MRTLIATVLYVFCLVLATTGHTVDMDFIWANHYGGLEFDYAGCIATDDDGNSYVAGTFESTAYFGPHTLVSQGVTDIYIIKVDCLGQVIWAKRAGGPMGDSVAGIVLDYSGHFYITGRFLDEAHFDTTRLVSYGGYDVFIAKCDTSGNVVWAQNAGGPDWDGAGDITVDDHGQPIITGYFGDTGSFDSTPVVSDGTHDIYVAKYDASGAVIWVQRAGGTDFDYGYGVAVDGSDCVIVTGEFRGHASFGGTTLYANSDEIFIAKVDDSGRFLWARQAGGPYEDSGFAVAVDHQGNSYVTGCFVGTADFDSITLQSEGDEDIFVAKYDASGNILWARRAGGSSIDVGSDIIIDGTDGCIVTGFYAWSGQFGTIPMTSYGREDSFVAKYDMAGNAVWVKGSGGISEDRGTGVSMDGEGHIYLTGWFERDNTFDAISITSTGHRDLFVAKLMNTTRVDDVKETAMRPEPFFLFDTAPNPFNEQTTISYWLREAANVRMTFFNMQGRTVDTMENKMAEPGLHQVTWNAHHLESGLYFYRITAGPYSDVGKCMLIK